MRLLCSLPSGWKFRYTARVNLLLFTPQDWDAPLCPEDPRAVHIRTILKSCQGDPLQVGLLNTGTGTASVKKLGDDGSVDLLFPPVWELEPTAELLPVHLVLGHPRPPVFRRILKDVASFGISRLSVCATELSEKSYFSSHLWTKNQFMDDLLEGAQQGGQTRLTQVARYWSIGDFFRKNSLPKTPTIQENRYILDLDSRAPFLYNQIIDSHGPEMTLAIGPERGWTSDEVQQFLRNGYTTVQLGRAIWRTEAACLFAAGLAIQVAQDRECHG